MIDEKEIMNYIYKQRDPPEEDKAFREDETFQERKQKIKRKIREELSKNQVLSRFLQECKNEGKFIKAYTDKLLKYTWCSDTSMYNTIETDINHSYSPIDSAIIWRNTPQGHEYWRDLSHQVDYELSVERRRKKTNF